MKRILLATPAYTDFPKPYMNSITAYLTRELGIKLDFFYTGATYVEQARDELVSMLLKHGHDEIVWQDLDNGHFNQAIQLELFKRLLSHDVDIVSGQYTTHTVRSNFLGRAIPGSAPDERGLLPMELVPLGFCKVKRHVYEEIPKKFPERHYIQRNPSQEPKPLYQYHRNGLVGPNTPGAKLSKIKDIMEKCGTTYNATILEEIAAIIGNSDYSENVFMGEDYDFCCLARAAGFKIFMDTQMIIPHETRVGLPISNADVLHMIGERWRNLNPADLRKVADALEEKQ